MAMMRGGAAGERGRLLAELDRLGKRERGAGRLLAAIDLGELHRPSGISRVLGPDHADALVRASRQLLQCGLDSGIRLFQVSADCFACILPDGSSDTAETLLYSLLRRFGDPLEHEGIPGMISPCAGVVRFLAGDMDGRVLLRAAMAAAQDARRLDQTCLLCDSTCEIDPQRVPSLLRGLRPALAAADQLSLVYQPRVDMRSGECLSAEALLRWQHPTLGDVSPGEFIPLAEQTGMIRFITDWVVARALGEWAAQPAPERPRNVSINISPLNLGEENFAGRLGAAISRHGLAPGRVELEFTETALLHDTDPVSKTVRELAGLGVGIAIDDFGTGYSNLFYLRETPATTVKIDQSFIRPLCDSRRDQIIVQSMIHMAHDLGYRVVAEGIENREAYDMLAEWGCDEGQGFLISHPVPIGALAN
jgi:EAL domain-containing protein (putative c-di-GMP-specific phosphodiesterase class I)/GGDEF domain-containing protein